MFLSKKKKLLNMYFLEARIEETNQGGSMILRPRAIRTQGDRPIRPPLRTVLIT